MFAPVLLELLEENFTLTQRFPREYILNPKLFNIPSVAGAVLQSPLLEKGSKKNGKLSTKNTPKPDFFEKWKKII